MPSKLQPTSWEPLVENYKNNRLDVPCCCMVFFGSEGCNCLLFSFTALSPVEELLLPQGHPVSSSVQLNPQASEDLACSQQVRMGGRTISSAISTLTFMCCMYNVGVNLAMEPHKVKCSTSGRASQQLAALMLTHIPSQVMNSAEAAMLSRIPDS